MNENELLKDLLQQVLDDATADTYFPNKRVWAIRARLYREIASAIGYEYKSDRANMSYEDLVERMDRRASLANKV